jgi:membrane protein DedA with SNARE-associated domain
MKKDARLKNSLLGLAVVRILIGLAAIPMAPFLYREHFIALVLMRPTKEVLLAGGFLLRLGKVGLVPLIAAALPLGILGVWHSYYLGRFHASQIRSGRGMPWWVKRVLRPDRVKQMQDLLDRKGMRIVFLGRMAVFPSSVAAAAAGAGDVPSREFLPADGLGGLLSVAMTIGAGWGLGTAYKRAGPWITVAGVCFLIALAYVIARYLRADGKTRKKNSGARKGRRKPGRSRSKGRATSRS